VRCPARAAYRALDAAAVADASPAAALGELAAAGRVALAAAAVLEAQAAVVGRAAVAPRVGAPLAACAQTQRTCVAEHQLERNQQKYETRTHIRPPGTKRRISSMSQSCLECFCY
jgi:hypothetical protein